MRLIVELVSMYYMPYNRVTGVHLQGMLYNLLKRTRYGYKHDLNGFKFFNFSNLFPVGDFRAGYSKRFVVSSPDKGLIDTLYHILKTRDTVRLHNNPFIVKKVKKFNKKLPMGGVLCTSTPICLYESRKVDNGVMDRWFSFKNKGGVDFDWFFERLKNNALKKYNAFTGDEYAPVEPLFDGFEFKKEVAHSLYSNHSKTRFLVIGSLWNRLMLNKDLDKRFYNFILDTGLGEKNSMGYGALNVKK